jgi:hypothetical protein
MTVMTNERVQLVLTRTAILVETVMTANDPTCLPDVRTRFLHGWRGEVGGGGRQARRRLGLIATGSPLPPPSHICSVDRPTAFSNTHARNINTTEPLTGRLVGDHDADQHGGFTVSFAFPFFSSGARRKHAPALYFSLTRFLIPPNGPPHCPLKLPCLRQTLKNQRRNVGGRTDHRAGRPVAHVRKGRSRHPFFFQSSLARSVVRRSFVRSFARSTPTHQSTTHTHTHTHTHTTAAPDNLCRVLRRFVPHVRLGESGAAGEKEKPSGQSRNAVCFSRLFVC